MIRQLIEKWTWLCECLFLLRKGWRPARCYVSKADPRAWRWTIVWGGVQLQFLRRAAWFHAKDRNKELLDVRRQLADSRHEVDRCRLLLATTLQILAMRGSDEADELGRDILEVRLRDEINAELKPKKKVAA